MTKKINLAILASGSGTNTENIVKFFRGNPKVDVTKILSNKPNAYVLERAKNLNIPTEVFDKAQFNDPAFLSRLSEVDYIILAGFLWLIPYYLIEAFPEKIINIHPALLPDYGGKGMYGDRVHKAVIEAREKESGITIHLVNEEYDKGRILFQAKCEVAKDDSAETLATKIHQLEYEHFPKVIADLINT